MSDPDGHLDVPLEEIEAARERIGGLVHRTPLLTSATAAGWVTAASGVRIADDRLYLKAEHLQKTGSFKARGMSNRIATLSPEARSRGAITLSAGNAGQAYAWAGRAAGVPVTVVMPAGAVRSKVDACLGYGARVVLHGAHVGETLAEIERIRDAEGLTYCPPIRRSDGHRRSRHRGPGALDDVPDVDVVVVGVGGRRADLRGRRGREGAAGRRAACTASSPSARTPCRSRSSANEVVRIQPESVADGLGAPFAGEWTLAMARRYVDDVVLLDDPTILAGLRFVLERGKQVLEPAGAAALAAVLAGRIPIRDGERVAVVLSGGNVEITRLGELLERAATLPGATA